MKRVLNKLAHAGWIQRSAVYDAKLGEQPGIGVGIAWTKRGQKRMGNLLSLISEIEKASSPMSEDEWKGLKAVAQYSAKASESQGDAGNNPPRQ